MINNQCPKPPRALYHVTTGKKAKSYRQSGRIKGPVRGFDTLQGAMAWAIKVGRKVIFRVDCVTNPQMLPDHHNEWGNAWWTGDVPVDRLKCVYVTEGSWPRPDGPSKETTDCDAAETVSFDGQDRESVHQGKG